MKLSIIIPTYNGAGKILNCLDAIEFQTVKPWEILVVIDGSTDNTLEILKSHTTGSRLRIINQENKGRAGVRNTGAKEAGGDLLLFVDDDMRLERDVLEKHLAFHEQTEGAVLIGNQLEQPEKMKTGFQKFKAHLSRKWFLGLADRLKQINIPFITAAHFSILKRDFTLAGGFDERLTDAEDMELAARLLQRGMRLFVDPSLIGWHDDFITCEKYIARQKQYKAAHKKLAEINPVFALEGTSKVPAFHSVKKFFFGSKIWVRLIDNSPTFLDYLPEKIRFRIYDWVLTTHSLL